jgi:predicted acylesterase/phospholipase RssA
VNAVEEAQEIIRGARADFPQVERLANQLPGEGHGAVAARLLIEISRRALYQGWERERRADLAKLLRDHQQFGYARRLLRRVREEDGDSDRLRDQHAFCTYKDRELPAVARLERALEILKDGRSLESITSAETLGIAGAIYKRRWEVTAQRVELENALWCYDRGYALDNDPNRYYAGINAAFVRDQLAAAEEEAIGAGDRAQRLRDRADEIRSDIVERLTHGPPIPGSDERWDAATLGEALFGLGHFDAAAERLERVQAATNELWRRETTLMQLSALARLRHPGSPEARAVLVRLMNQNEAAVARAYRGKVGLALSGGGFRASLFHIGVLARLAERGVLRQVEVLSCVSGGSIVGAFYYLRLRELLQEKRDGELDDEDYLRLVRDLSKSFLAGVRMNLRGRLTEDVRSNWKMMSSRYSRTDRVAELLEALFYGENGERRAARRMDDLRIAPKDEPGFSPVYDNWLRAAKVPALVLNATTLNTGHGWQFTASWMGESPAGIDEEVDASQRLRRVYYRDAPGDLRNQSLAKAVAASACVPMLFAPVTIEGLYEGAAVELVDGGVHDNQGVASLLDQDCTVILVSDASGQIRDQDHPRRLAMDVASRSNTILMSRVRAAQFADLGGRRKAEILRGLMIVHLRRGLGAEPRDWIGCQEKFDAKDDARQVTGGSSRERYGIDPGILRALAELRTDLDSFSDAEAYSLMAAGYAMTRVELEGALRDLPAMPDLQGSVDWCFASALAELGGSEALRKALLPGRARFARRFVAWRQARAGKAPSLVARVARGTRAAGATAVMPIRKIVTAPLALVAGAATRLSLRLRRG